MDHVWYEKLSFHKLIYDYHQPLQINNGNGNYMCKHVNQEIVYDLDLDIVNTRT